MNVDFAVSVGVIAVAALILNFKSHVKFIAMGLFIGLALTQTISLGIQETLSAKIPFLSSEAGLSTINISLLLLPALILGVNHSNDKKRTGLMQTIFFVAGITMFMLVLILSFLPENVRQMVLDRSLIAFQLYYGRLWLLVAAAAIVILDSFTHRRDRNRKHKKH